MTLRRLKSACPFLLLAFAAAGGCAKRESTASPASQPDSRPAPTPRTPAAGADWPAFHGGGPLQGVAASIGPPPMRVRWTYRTDESDPAGIEGSAAIAGDVAYVADQKGRLHAVDLATGKRRWRYSAGRGFSTTPLVLDGRVMLGDLAGIFHAVAIADGRKLWTFDCGSPIHSSANAIGKRVVFGDDDADIYCLEASDGKIAWQQKAGDRINSAPAVVGGLVFLCGCDAQLRAIGSADGAEKFAIDMGALSGASPAVVGDSVVIGTDSGRVVCFEAGAAKQRWLFEGIKDHAMVYASPAIAEGIVVVGARDRHVYGLDLMTGVPKWDFSTHGDVDSSPVISGGRVYVGSKDKRLYVLDLKSGENLWEFRAAGKITAAPAIGRGVLVQGDEAGSVYCLESEGAVNR